MNSNGLWWTALANKLIFFGVSDGDLGLCSEAPGNGLEQTAQERALGGNTQFAGLVHPFKEDLFSSEICWNWLRFELTEKEHKNTQFKIMTLQMFSCTLTVDMCAPKFSVSVGHQGLIETTINPHP